MAFFVDADIVFCTKLNRRLDLSSHNRADIWLMNGKRLIVGRFDKASHL